MSEQKQYLKVIEGGLRLSLYVQPNAPKTLLVGEYNGALKLKVNAPPVDGKANKEIIAFFAKYLSLSKSSICILRGETGRLKLMEIRCEKPESLIETLETVNR